jgi:lipoyl-dependent peroxiredoxin
VRAGTTSSQGSQTCLKTGGSSTPPKRRSPAGGPKATVVPRTAALEVDLRTPVETGGSGGGTNPKPLFAIGYAACFESAMGVAARRRRQEVADVAIDSSVMPLATDDRGFKLAVALAVTLPSGSDPHEAVLRDAHSRAAPGARAAAVAVEAIVSIAAESAGRRRRHPRGDRRLSRLASRIAQRRDRPRVGLVRPRESGPPEPHLGAVGMARLPRASEAPCMPVGVNKLVSGDATMTVLGA